MTSGKRNTYFLISVLALIWGSSFILMKKALLVYSPYQVGSCRIFVACLSMLPFIINHFGKIEKSKWKYLAISGILGNGIPSVLFPLAETHVDSALAGMINSLTPIFTLIIGVLIFGMKAGLNRLLGLAIGLFGAILLITGQTGGAGINETNVFALYIVISTIFYAISVNVLRYKLNTTDSIRNTGFAVFISGIPMGIILFSGDFISRTISTTGSGESLACILILGLLGTAFSTVLFNRLIKISGALAASSVTYLIPIVAVIWGILDHEVFGIYHVLGLSFILGGVYLVNRQK